MRRSPFPEFPDFFLEKEKERKRKRERERERARERERERKARTRDFLTVVVVVVVDNVREGDTIREKAALLSFPPKHVVKRV